MFYKSILLLIFLSIFSPNLHSQFQWVNQKSPISDDLKDIYFIDSLYGWTVSDSNIVGTIDGGENWVLQNIPSTISGIAKIQFVNRESGFVIGDAGLFLRSGDCGENWEIIEYDSTYNISDLSFIDSENGWITVWQETINSRTSRILHTTDAGNTWENQKEVNSYQLFGSTLFKTVRFFDNNIGWVLGGDYADNFSATYIYSTTDAGKTWQKNIASESWPMVELEVISSDTLWISGAPLVISFNSGKSWDCPNCNDGGALLVDTYSVSPISGLRGWAVHNENLNNQHGIFYTEDGGANWKNEITFNDKYATAITTYNKDYLWIAGKDGLIMRRNNITSVSEEETISRQFVLEQNYPNPFNPITTIKYTIPNVGGEYIRPVKLKIYDLLGREIATLVNKEQSPGNYRVEFEGNDLPSGIYIYTLTAGNFSTSCKMVLLK